MSEFGRLGAQPPAIKTQAELLQNLRNRETPDQELAPSPPDGVQNLVEEKRSEQERRISDLRRGLDSAHRNLETQHSFARLSGHAKSSFKHER